MIPRELSELFIYLTRIPLNPSISQRVSASKTKQKSFHTALNSSSFIDFPKEYFYFLNTRRILDERSHSWRQISPLQTKALTTIQLAFRQNNLRIYFPKQLMMIFEQSVKINLLTFAKLIAGIAVYSIILWYSHKNIYLYVCGIFCYVYTIS